MLAAKRIGAPFIANSIRPSATKVITRSVGMLRDPSVKYKCVARASGRGQGRARSWAGLR